MISTIKSSSLKDNDDPTLTEGRNKHDKITRNNRCSTFLLRKGSKVLLKCLEMVINL